MPWKRFCRVDGSGICRLLLIEQQVANVSLPRADFGFYKKQCLRGETCAGSET